METPLEKIIGLDFTITGNGRRWRNTLEHSSLILDLDNQLWFWNSRGILHKKPIEYLTLIRGMPEKQAKELVKDLAYVTGTDLISPGKKDTVVQNEKLVDIFWKNGINDRDYWYRRCLTDKTIDTYKLGKHDGFWTLPIYMDGKFMNFQCRTDVPAKKIKSWYRGVGPLLFNSSILPFVTTVVISEGVVDAILLCQLGFPAVSQTGGAGTWLSGWFSYFRHQKEIIYLADNDIAGRVGAKKVARNLGEYRVKIYDFNGFPDKTDAVSYFRDYNGSTDGFRDLIKNAKYEFQ
jgi:hypothetical protein